MVLYLYKKIQKTAMARQRAAPSCSLLGVIVILGIRALFKLGRRRATEGEENEYDEPQRNRYLNAGDAANAGQRQSDEVGPDALLRLLYALSADLADHIVLQDEHGALGDPFSDCQTCGRSATTQRVQSSGLLKMMGNPSSSAACPRAQRALREHAGYCISASL
jgi:hypothetical protein